jgi:hypothetical protein
MKNITPPCKMDTPEAEILWNNLSYQQKLQFAEFYPKLMNGELRFEEINIDKNERLKNIVLVPKEQMGAPDKPFYKHFNLKE